MGHYEHSFWPCPPPPPGVVYNQVRHDSYCSGHTTIPPIRVWTLQHLNGNSTSQSARRGIQFSFPVEVNHAPGSYVHSMEILYWGIRNTAGETTAQLERALRVNNTRMKVWVKNKLHILANILPLWKFFWIVLRWGLSTHYYTISTRSVFRPTSEFLYKYFSVYQWLQIQYMALLLSSLKYLSFTVPHLIVLINS